MRTVVVGASSGLGRVIGIGLAHRGARVALLARRIDKLEEAAKEAGPGTLAIACDVTDESSVTSSITAAAAGLGGIDALVYCPGVGPLSRLVDLDVETWRWAFDTNVIGAALLTAAAVPHLAATTGNAVYLSSVSTSSTPPWPGLGAYVVSKAALDKLVEAWRAEHPDVGFTRLVVGECNAATEFSAGWDPAVAAEFYPVWMARNYMSGALLEVEELVDTVDLVLRLGPSTSIPSVTVAPRGSATDAANLLRASTSADQPS